MVYNEFQHKHLLEAFMNQVQPTKEVKPQRFLLTSEFLNNLIQFCKAQTDVTLSDEAVLAISELYSKLRRNESRGLLVTARSLESLIRLATALCKLSYPPRQVSREDVVEAYVLVRHSLFGETEGEIRRTIITTKKAAVNESVRYELFVQAFSEIIEEQGANQTLAIAELQKLISAWMAERKDLGKNFTSSEFNHYLDELTKRVEGVHVEDGFVYY